jgi:hypothetical protein
MLIVDRDTGPRQQSGWRMCANCRVLFYGPSAASSACPAGPHHNPSGSATFAMQIDDKSSPTSQKGWRWCKNCEGLVYGPNASHGPCPVGTGWSHDPSASAAYVLPFLESRGLERTNSVATSGHRDPTTPWVAK